MSTGPYLLAALICERVITENDGVLSIVRIIDRLAHSLTEPNVVMSPITYPLTYLIILKSGTARGTYQVSINVENPAGLITVGPSMTILLEGEDRGQNIIMKTAMTFNSDGLYWFLVMLDDQEITRIPFRVMYLRSSGFGLGVQQKEV